MKMIDYKFNRTKHRFAAKKKKKKIVQFKLLTFSSMPLLGQKKFKAYFLIYIYMYIKKCIFISLRLFSIVHFRPSDKLHMAFHFS